MKLTSQPIQPTPPPSHTTPSSIISIPPPTYVYQPQYILKVFKPQGSTENFLIPNPSDCTSRIIHIPTRCTRFPHPKSRYIQPHRTN